MARTVPSKKVPKEVKRQTAASGHIAVDGELTPVRLLSLRTALATAIGNAPAVTVDCAGATGPRLGLIQLILSARKTAFAAGKTVALAKPATGEFLETLRRAGFVSAEGAIPAPEQAFWLNASSAVNASNR